MYRQKGTGNARAGSRRSPIRRGGGHTFAKRPRDWTYRLPKKAVRLATRMALAARIADNEVKLIDELSFAAAEDQGHGRILKALKIDGKRLLVAIAGLRRQRLQEHPQPGRRVGPAGRRTSTPWRCFGRGPC